MTGEFGTSENNTMRSTQDVQDIFGAYTRVLDDELSRFLNELSKTNLDLYKHITYFLGFADESLNPQRVYGGKRFRPSLILMLTDWYGKENEALPVALSVELFHNFTLIHDDVVDGDELRRGRPTVWKLWGKHHAINDGDALLLLAHLVLAEKTNDPEILRKILCVLLPQYQKVVEGQYLDFVLAEVDLDDKKVTKEMYFDMVGKKTATLIAASAQAAGIISSVSADEQNLLYKYGYELGVAYQISDDLVSIWDSGKMEGDRLYNDIYERKKTLPILSALEMLPQKQRNTLVSVFNSREDLSEKDAKEIAAMLSGVDVQTYVRRVIETHVEKAKYAAQSLSLDSKHKGTLCDIVDVLLPAVEIK